MPDGSQGRDNLISYLFNRIDSVKAQLSASFWPKRQKYYMQMMDDFSFRQGGGTGRYMQDEYFRGSSFDDTDESSIFDISNDSLNIVGGFAAFMAARATDDTLGTWPIYGIYPEGRGDIALSETIQKHSEWKIRRSPWIGAATDAIDNAVGLGEAVIKQSWDKDIDTYETRANLLCDAQNGGPIVTMDGQYLFDTDTYQVATILFNGVAQSVFLFEKAPMEPIPTASSVFAEKEVEQTNVLYNNIRAAVIATEDFLCAENEEDIHTADFVAHRIQRRLSYLKSRYGLTDDQIAELQTDDLAPKTAEAKPDPVRGEQQEGFNDYEQRDPWIELYECWVRYDPIGDLKPKRMRVVFAKKSRMIVAMDYIANVTPTGELPFHVVRSFRVKGRWWGRGYYEIYDKAQDFIDRQLNYVANRNEYHANPAIFMDFGKLEEGQETVAFRLAPGQTYKLKDGYTKEQVMSIIELPDLDERTWQLMQMMIQVIQVRSGVTSAAQGEVSALPSTSTATGIESILQSASTLARMPMNEMKRGLEQSLLYAIKLIYSNMDQAEMFTYLEGDQEQIGQLTQLQVKDLEMNVRLTMTRFKQREALESATKGAQFMAGYVALPEMEKEAQRPMFVQGMKGLGFDNANAIVRKPMQTVIDPATGQPTLVPMGSQPSLPAPGQAPALPAPASNVTPMPQQQAA